MNIRSIVSKINEIRAWVCYYKPNIITISETWLHSQISDVVINIDDYILYRCDRASRGGGVATYISASLVSERVIPNVEPDHFECLFIRVTLQANKKIIIGNIYRPPAAPSDSTMCILSTINSFDKQHELILLGDFNSNWLDCSSAKDRNLFGSVNLTQLITETTRIDSRSSILIDWILVTNPDRIIKSGVMSDCLSDHSVIFCVWKINTPRLPPKFISLRQCKNMNEDSFIHDLINIKWDRFQFIPTVEDAWSFFHSEVTNIINKRAPLKTVKESKADIFPG